MLLAAVIASAALAGCSKADSDSDRSAPKKAAPVASVGDHSDLPAMTVDEVDKAVAAKEATAVDCNNPRTRKRMGTIPGAILISDDANYAASELPADKTTKLVFFCANPG